MLDLNIFGDNIKNLMGHLRYLIVYLVCGVLASLALLFVLQGCATTRPPPADSTAYREKAKSSSIGDVMITVAVPTTAEAEAIYGVKLKWRIIQPVWVEVKNNSTKTY